MMIAATVSAQPMLTYANDAPLADTHFLVFSGPGLDPGPAGANAVYDLEDFGAVDTAWSHFYAAGGTPLGCPGLDTMNLTGYGGCLRLVDTALYAYPCGSYLGTLPMIGTTGRTLMRYPFTFGDSLFWWWGIRLLQDTCSGFDVFYSDTLKADGYGSLLTPFGTFAPVLRVHTETKILWDTVMVEESYRYFLPGVRYPVAEIKRGYPFEVADSIWTTWLLDPATVGLRELSEGDVPRPLYPVPVSDRLHWDQPEGEYAFDRLLVMDTQGRGLRSFHPADAKAGMDVHDLAPGLYTLFEEMKGEHRFIGRFTKQ